MLSSKQPSLDHTEFSGFTDLSWYLDPQVTFDWVPEAQLEAQLLHAQRDLTEGHTPVGIKYGVRNSSILLKMNPKGLRVHPGASHPAKVGLRFRVWD